MIKKGLLIAFVFMLTACAGAMKVAEDDKKGSTPPTKTVVVKPNK